MKWSRFNGKWGKVWLLLCTLCNRWQFWYFHPQRQHKRMAKHWNSESDVKVHRWHEQRRSCQKMLGWGQCWTCSSRIGPAMPKRSSRCWECFAAFAFWWLQIYFQLHQCYTSAFLYEHCFGSFFYLHVTRKSCRNDICKKCACIMLMKFTPYYQLHEKLKYSQTWANDHLQITTTCL